jgi:hypothetical protein
MERKMEFNEIGFAEWCLCNTDYSFDTDGKFWYNSKTFKQLSWKEVYKEYKKVALENLYKKYKVAK